MQLSSEERDWLSLHLVPGIGPRLAAALLRRFGSAAAVLQASESALLEIPHLPAATAAGVPAEEIPPLIDLFTRVLDGHNAHLADGVQRVLGRPARDFADYARDAAAAGVWNTDTDGGSR